MQLEWNESGDAERRSPPTQEANDLEPPPRPPRTALGADADEPAPHPRLPAATRWGGARPPGPPPALVAFVRDALAAVDHALEGVDGIADRVAARLGLRR